MSGAAKGLPEQAPKWDREAVVVVIPLYNEGASVDRLLSSLTTQTVAPGQVVCVDAGSEDDTPKRVTAFLDTLPLRLLRRSRLNPGEARNEGVRHSTKDWIAFTDGGNVAEPFWLEGLLRRAASGADAVFGSYEPVCDSFFRRCAALAYIPARSSEGIRGPFVASMLLRRSVFEAVGRFPPYRASEDLILMERLQQTTFSIAYAPDAIVHFEIAHDMRSTFRRFALYSRINLEVGRGRYWHHGVLRQYVLAFVLLLAGAHFGAGWWLFSAPILWFGLRVLKAAWKKRDGDLPFPVFRPDYLVGAAAILVVLDAATWIGVVRFLAARIARRAPR
jgi:glycosyltransferase involved in cell wall biosynthesis